MDPNAALINMRATIEQADRDFKNPVADFKQGVLENREDTIRALVEHFEALDGWLSRGGFYPADWTSDWQRG